jgi:hypothetical protein
MKIIDKRGRSTSTNGWKWKRAIMVLADGAERMLKVNAHIVRAYSPTWTSAHAWQNRVNGGGVRSSAIFKDLWEVNTYALIVCSSCNVSQSLAMYQRKWVCIFWWPFSPPCGGNDKHQEWKSKNACQVVMLDGSTTNWAKGMHKARWTLTWKTYGMWWYEQGFGNQDGKH